MHPNEGQLHAYHTHNLPVAESERVKAHLAGCPRCQAQVQALAERMHHTGRRLAALNPQPGEAAPSEHIARQRLQSKINRQENLSMFNKLFSPRLRPAWGALAIVLALAIALSFPQVRATASSFLGLFRVQQIAVIPIDGEAASEKMSALDRSLMEDLFEGGHEETLGESIANASVEEASAAAGIAVRLPENMTPESISVEPGMRMTLPIDQPTLQALFDELGFEIDIPKEADGATITGEIQPVVFASFNCRMVEEGTIASDTGNPSYSKEMTTGNQCANLIQVASPTIDAPIGLDITALGEGYLQLLGMSPEEAKNFSQTVDWATTLVIPMPQNGSSSYENVTVEGVEGVLLRESTWEEDGHYILIWSKNGVVYALADKGTNAEALALANSLQ
ncbi:MAG: anti-sigma factor family protein [Chloroflexota bacterium]